MKKILFYSLILIGLFSYVSCGTAKVQVVNPTVEMRTDPQGLGVATPRFSWQIASEQNNVQQTVYRILVASSKSKLSHDKADIWDSKTVGSARSAYISYGGLPLKSRQECWWKVIVVTKVGVFKDGAATDGTRTVKAESAPAHFTMGLLNPEDWTARWIGRQYPQDSLTKHTKVPARYLRKDFAIGGPVRKATLYISGLGLYEAFINGKQIAPDQVLSPTVSDYNVTVYYNTFDVTSDIAKGDNVLDVILGNGRYTSMRIPGVKHYDVPKLLLQLEVTYKDGKTQTIVSDQSWKITADGPIRYNNEFDGEFYDANKETLSHWDDAVLVSAPAGKLRAQPNPNIKIQDTVKPVAINKVGDAYVMDMGQNMVGWLQVKVSGAQKGDTLRFHFAETVNPDGSIYTANLRSAETTDTYIAKDDKPFTWHPVFTYHGFRFVEIKGLRQEPQLSDFEGQVFYDEMATTGTFETSNDVINKVYHNAFWGIRSNYRGMPTDCPQRDERMGWMGDRTTGCYGEGYIFNNHQLYAKWLQDIEESQGADGNIPDVAPIFWEIRSDNVTWPGVFITAADMIYTQYGDSKPIIDHYQAMRKWLVYMKDKYGKDGLITKDQYGDWCVPPESLTLIHSKDPSRATKGAIISTPFYAHLCRIMIDFAQIAGHPEDVGYFKNEIALATEGLNRRYFKADKGYYGDNTITSNILPLYFNMVPDGYQQKVFDNIITRTEKDFGGHVAVGVVGIEELMRTLSDNGRIDLAYKMASDTTYPSWGYMAKSGATTIWELWNGNTADPAMNSRNHVMILGDLIIWEYSYLGGISPINPGYSSFMLNPRIVSGLKWVNASYDSIYGKIVSNWKVENSELFWHIQVPCNTAAKVYIPYKVPLTKAYERIFERMGARKITKNGQSYVYLFPSGTYDIRIPYEDVNFPVHP